MIFVRDTRRGINPSKLPKNNYSCPDEISFHARAWLQRWFDSVNVIYTSRRTDLIECLSKRDTRTLTGNNSKRNSEKSTLTNT